MKLFWYSSLYEKSSILNDSVKFTILRLELQLGVINHISSIACHGALQN